MRQQCIRKGISHLCIDVDSKRNIGVKQIPSCKRLRLDEHISAVDWFLECSDWKDKQTQGTPSLSSTVYLPPTEHMNIPRKGLASDSIPIFELCKADPKTVGKYCVSRTGVSGCVSGEANSRDHLCAVNNVRQLKRKKLTTFSVLQEHSLNFLEVRTPIPVSDLRTSYEGAGAADSETSR